MANKKQRIVEEAAGMLRIKDGKITNLNAVVDQMIQKYGHNTDEHTIWRYVHQEAAAKARRKDGSR